MPYYIKKFMLKEIVMKVKKIHIPINLYDSGTVILSNSHYINEYDSQLQNMAGIDII